MENNYVTSGIFGLCIGDALGVPVEFTDRQKLKADPVKDMKGGGTYGQPSGTWSDDSSMALCLAESLINGVDYEDMAARFCRWIFQGYWTPFGKAFDVGRTTLSSLTLISKGARAVDAGLKRERDNGNGSLMRILPLAFYLNSRDYEKRSEIIHNVSSITHGHIRSYISCDIYVQYAIYLVRGMDKKEAYNLVRKEIPGWYKEKSYTDELKHFERILKEDISEYSEDEINSSGYVIDTLEAALWCFLTSSSYKEAVLKAVNLGEDTDTTAAVTGGLAGIYYGLDGIPSEWIDKLQRKEDIYRLSDKLFHKL